MASMGLHCALLRLPPREPWGALLLRPQGWCLQPSLLRPQGWCLQPSLLQLLEKQPARVTIREGFRNSYTSSFTGLLPASEPWRRRCCNALGAGMIGCSCSQ